MRLLTTTEAAKYLRLKERKIYELVAEGAIPCTKVTGRWLFPQAELDHWLSSSLMRPKGLAPAEPMPIVGGSHDPLLEWALRESSSGLATLPEGSEAGLARLANGTIVAAAIHLHSHAANRGFWWRQAIRLELQGLPTLLREERAWPCVRRAPARNCCCSRCCTGWSSPSMRSSW